jgi:hypothetical protein
MLNGTDPHPIICTIASGQENNPVSQYEFSKSVATAADNLNFDSIYAYDHLVPHYKDDVEKKYF